MPYIDSQQDKISGKLFDIFKWSSIFFILFNIFIRFVTLFDISSAYKLFFWCLPVCLLLFLFNQAFLKYLFFLFGFSFFLFGFRPYDIESQVFETLVAFMALTVGLLNVQSKPPGHFNKNLFCLLLCYAAFSTLSLLSFPLDYLIKSFYYFGLKDSLFQIVNASTESVYYSFAGLNRLLLFFIFCVQISMTNHYGRNYSYLFSGVFAAAVFSSIIGIIDFYGIISLAWYRHNTTLTDYALHSTFLNRGWFSEFVVVTVPFVLLGFTDRKRSNYRYFLYFSIIIICEVALILSGSRAGWVSYPIVLIVCWFFFYFFKQGNIDFSKINYRDLIKVFLSVPITILVSIFFIFKIVMPLTQNYTIKSSEIALKNKASENYLISQSRQLIEPSGRFEVWNHGFSVGRQKPIWGIGYESFGLHGNILTKISDSYYHRNTSRRVEDTPHNTYLQLFVSGGIMGVVIWLLIVCYTTMILIKDFIQNKNFLNIAVIISIISFHINGIFQSMQYIPMIWLCIFLYLGYAMLIREEVLSPRYRKNWWKITKAVLVIVCISPIAYGLFPFSEILEDKYSLNAYALDYDRNKYIGFYNLEKRETGDFRWSGERAVIYEKAKSDYVKLVVNADPLNSNSKEGLELKLSLNEKLLDRIHFFNGGTKELNYFIPNIAGENIRLNFEVSKTFRPFLLGLSRDYRGLGVCVSPISFPDSMPDDGIGFYNWETWGHGDIAGWPEGKKPKFRWSGIQASLVLPPFNHQELGLFLMCAHPDIKEHPVKVTLLLDERIIQEMSFTENKWIKTTISADKLKSAKVITIKVNRTWNPKIYNFSEDQRDLGVAVATLF